ncbi:hypothetical protein CANINC_000416 [Pichia inconspicua]|uniref:Glycosyltransferase family 71 protein n=1 Tax=Pichia inconspicua TaxID=52247 RepID=A0A4V4NG84_9ASCO|nr:hypothetical protein CANINC_000416 [[Candida] inconspicua]
MVRYLSIKIISILIISTTLLFYITYRPPKLQLNPIFFKYRSIHNTLIENDPTFPSRSIADKCNAYFQTLQSLQPDWSFTQKLGPDYPHDNIRKSEDLIHLNVFNRCFISENSHKTKHIFQKSNDSWNIQQRMFPYLSGELPEFKDSNLDVKPLKFDGELPYWLNYKENIIKGQGIVISLSDTFINEAILLLNHLQDLQNTLPIQFIHRADLSIANMAKLIAIAKSKNPVQEVSFLNVTRALSSEYKNEFRSYFNKLLAYAFNTFEEIIILDTDVVLFNSPKSLFKTKAYKQSETLFFKDRNTEMRMSDAYIKFLRETSMNEFDNLFFPGVSINPSFWENEYFTNRYFHYMESGVVVINRKKYWNAVLLSLQLPYIQSTAIASWGDKEFFWLSMLLSGYDSFKFNKYWSATVGEVIQENELNSPHKICSGHPAHILDETDELLWINSGILNCDKTTQAILQYDFELLQKYNNNRFKSITDLTEYYTKPIKFEAFIIPPV